MIFLHSYYTSDAVAMLAKNTFTYETGNSVSHRINSTFWYLIEEQFQMLGDVGRWSVLFC
jgi:hypothetical protein